MRYLLDSPFRTTCVRTSVSMLQLKNICPDARKKPFSAPCGLKASAVNQADKSTQDLTKIKKSNVMTYLS